MSLSLRARVARWGVLATNRLSRLTRRGAGTVVGGRVGQLIAPHLLGQLSAGRTVICVSGTNGKTTTTAMIATGWGGPVVTNPTGANMTEGHVAALVLGASPHVVLEVDEGWLPIVIEETRCRVVVLLNLSRDQLDRANEVRQMAERWKACLEGHDDPELVVVANANDPLVVYAASSAKNVRWCDVPTLWLDDARSCPRCTRALHHESDHWYCACGFAKPTNPSTVLRDALVVGGVTSTLALSIPGAFNRANAAMAVTALDVVGVAPHDSVPRINDLKDVAGRFTIRQLRGQSIRLMLAKNPAGFAAILSTIEDDASDLVIAINARLADGHDPSWLYDVPFERLRGHRVWCLGDRRLDLATRLEYADVDFAVLDEGSAWPLPSRPLDVIANYTAFSELLAGSTP